MDARQERWRSESEFFDRWAQEAGHTLTPTDPLALARYRRPGLRRRFNKEFRFRLLGELAGKRLLDVGCGDGSNAVLLAQMGASVTGIDVSPGAIGLAKRRAELNGVGGRTRFLCHPLEEARFSRGEFDIVWGDAILHHLIGELDQVVRDLVAWARPGGLLLFAEPVNFNQTLRRLRFLVPVHTEATPGERPLEPAEIAILQSHIPDLRMERFTLLGRLDRFVLPGCNYERASVPRRALTNLLAMTDYMALRIPGIRSMAGAAVLWGHAPSV